MRHERKIRHAYPEMPVSSVQLASKPSNEQECRGSKQFHAAELQSLEGCAVLTVEGGKEVLGRGADAGVVGGDHEEVPLTLPHHCNAAGHLAHATGARPHNTHAHT